MYVTANDVKVIPVRQRHGETARQTEAAYTECYLTPNNCYKLIIRLIVPAFVVQQLNATTDTIFTLILGQALLDSVLRST